MTDNQIKSDDKLLERLYKAAHRQMSKQELQRQRVSYVYGNLPKDSTITREQVEKVLAHLDGDPEAA